MITNPGQVSGTDSVIGRVFGPIGRTWDRMVAPTERFRRPFRRWRRGRPFTAGAFVAVAGVEISLVTQSALGKLLSMGVPGISTLFISVFLVVFAVTIWFFPAYRVFSGIATIMLALLSLVATNLGGFLLGFLMASFGGAFAVAWTPRSDYTADTRRQRRAARRIQAANQATETESAAAAGVATSTAALDGDTETQGTESGSAAESDEAAGSGAGPAVAEDAVDGPEYDRDTRIIEHYARPDESVADPSEPAPEEE